MADDRFLGKLKKQWAKDKFLITQKLAKLVVS